MSRSAVEGFVRRLFVDTDFRRRAAADTGKELRSFDLTPAERKALMGLFTRLGSGGGELPEIPRMDEEMTWL